jgi:hypothetical protein
MGDRRAAHQVVGKTHSAHVTVNHLSKGRKVYTQAAITRTIGVYVSLEAGCHDYLDDVAGNDQGYQ